MGKMRPREETTPEMDASSRRQGLMRMQDGEALSLDVLARKKHNPGRKKTMRRYYRNATLLRKYRKIKESAPVEEEELPPVIRERKKRQKSVPFTREFTAAQQEKEAAQEVRDQAAAEKTRAADVRKLKRKLATSRTAKGQPRMRDRIHNVLQKLQQQA